MIQRSQTIYLLLAFTCTTLLLFFPLFSVISTFQDVTVIAEISAYGFHVVDAPTVDVEGMTFSPGQPIEIPIYFIFISLALLSAMAIMLYKKRKSQLRVCRLNFFLHLIVVIAFYAFYYLGQGALSTAMTANEVEGVELTFGMNAGFFLLLAPLPFLIMAIRGIKNDEKLLQSIDRIR
ncbi:MAG: hypothetical protein ACI857_000099 [Arenicella sp.]|jgi:hypothetical protein